MADRLLLASGSLLLLANGTDHMLLAEIPGVPDATPIRRTYKTDHRRTYVSDHRRVYRTDHRTTHSS